MAVADPRQLSSGEVFLLQWLSKEDVSQYGECMGRDFDRLESLGLVTLDCAKDHPRAAFYAVRLTDRGIMAAQATAAAAGTNQ